MKKIARRLVTNLASIVPSHFQQSSYTGSISYGKESVNISEPYFYEIANFENTTISNTQTDINANKTSINDNTGIETRYYAKVENYKSKAVREMSNSVAEMMNVKGRDNKLRIRDRVETKANDVIENGFISNEARDRLIDQAFEPGSESNWHLLNRIRVMRYFSVGLEQGDARESIIKNN